MPPIKVPEQPEGAAAPEEAPKAMQFPDRAALGGSAFPWVYQAPDNPDTPQTVHFGMTTRDFMATQIMAGLSADTEFDPETAEEAANIAVVGANALLAACRRIPGPSIDPPSGEDGA